MLSKYFPLVKLSRKKFNDKDWITEGIKRSIKHRNNLFHIQLNCKSKENISKWKKYRNTLTKIIKDTQTKYYQNLIHQHSNSSIGLWKIFGNILSKKKNRNHKINEIKIDNKSIRDPKLITNRFNDFFCDIGPNLAKKFNNLKDSNHNIYLGTPASQSMYLRKK